MAVLDNSRRRIERANYVPLVREPGSEGAVRRTLEKLAFLTSLAVSEAELSILRVPEHDEGEPRQPEVLKALSAVVAEPGAVGRRKAVEALAEVPMDQLVDVGRRIAGLRRRAMDELKAVLEEITTRARDAGVQLALSRSMPGAMFAENALFVWAQDVHPELARQATALVELIGGSAVDPDAGGWELAPTDRRARCRADAASVLTDAFAEGMKVEPVGRLHLERLELIPAAVRRGELVYALALAPQEERLVTHREWSIRTEEFERIVEEESERQEDQSVNEKRELATSVESQSRRQTAFSLTASYTGLTVSGSADAQSSAEDADTHRQSRTDSMDVTRKASTRSRRDHKVSFKTTTVVGAETEEQHRLVNPSLTDAMRLEYFRLLREWQVELYRYGLRMTYDIVIPHPGLPLLETVAELRRTERDLAAPFAFDVPFALVSEDTYQELGRRNGITIPDPPPESQTLTDTHLFEGQGEGLVFDALEYEIDADYVITRARVACRFNVPNMNDPMDPREVYLDIVGQPGRAISMGNFEPPVDPDDRQQHLDVDLPDLVGRSGRVSVIVVRRELGEGSVEVTLDQELRPDVRPRWLNETWLALREAAQEQWGVERQMLLDRRERLQAEIGDYDALTLRKMEREAIMRGALQWLFGPDFEVGIEGDCVVPGDGGAVDVVDPPTWTAWQRVAEYGELIRFLQQAIEWENVIYLGYPYFWDTPTNWDVKATLRHPDFRHQEFLRAGFFRVVLTVRPGYEDALIALTETGVLNSAAGALAEDHPYLRIAEEIRTRSEELYRPVPANIDGTEQDDQENADRGRLIGRWREYTPIAGLDLAVNTPLDTIA